MDSYRISSAELERLVLIAHKEIMRFFHPDCCVIATRVLLDVLHKLNVKCAPVSLVAAFYGSEMARHVTEHDCGFWSCHEKLELHAEAIILGMPPGQRTQDPARTDPAEPFNGHVGVLVMTSEGVTLVDLTVEQASHPEYGIPLDGPLSFPVSIPFALGRAEAVAMSSEGITLRYIAYPGDFWYTINAPDWTVDSPIRTELTDSIFSRFNGGGGRYSAETLVLLGVTGRV